MVEKSSVKIISDGLGINTKILLDGKEIPNVTMVEIQPIHPNTLVTVILHLDNVELDINCEIQKEE